MSMRHKMMIMTEGPTRREARSEERVSGLKQRGQLQMLGGRRARWSPRTWSGSSSLQQLLLMLLLVLLLLVLVALSQTHARVTASQPAGKEKLAESVQGLRQTMKRVCKSNEKVKINSISEMKRLLVAIQRNSEACDPIYLSAAYELYPILKLERDDLCDERSINKVKEYHFRFIQPFRGINTRPSPDEPEPRELVKGQLHPVPRKWTVDFDEHGQAMTAPLAIRHFFLKFALQLSHQCKKNLINNLLADSERILTDEDRDMMRLFDKESPVGQALADGIERMDFDSVLYIPELDGKLKRPGGQELEAPGREQHLRTSAREDSALFQIIYACKNRFKPLYDRLVMPIVWLSKLGYDYQGPAGLSERERDFLTGPKMKNWLVMVHVCELFKNTHLVRLGPATSGSRGNQVDTNASLKSE